MEEQKRFILNVLIVFILIAVTCLVGSLVFASDRLLTWDGQAGATSYEVQQSLDYGKTWTVLATVPTTACTGTPVKCSVIQTLPITGVLMLRYGARNANGLTVRFDNGVWHCEACAPPGTIINQGIQ